MKLALFQPKIEPSVDENLSKSLAAVKAAAENGADLILFPEVQLTPFFPQYPGLDVRSYAAALDGDIVRSFQAVCRKSRIMAAPNIYLEENGSFYDASLLIGADGALLGVQKMVHIAQAPQFYEQDYYAPADDGFKVFDTPFGRIGLVICFDRHYPESIRTEALMGADLILVPTANVKAEPSETFEWEIRIQAFQNSAAIAMCNRVGQEGAMDFSGESLVVDANGQTVIKADDTEGFLFADVDLNASRTIRAARPYTTLRRPELYI